MADVVLVVDHLPERGGDALAEQSFVVAGGGFNVMAAAARQGLPVAYGGALGTGPFAEVVGKALHTEKIAVLQEPAPIDTGFVVSVVDADGERTFLTSPGAEATLTRAQLSRVHPAASDVVYLSGYGFAHPTNCKALVAWLAELDGAVDVIFDPGPAIDRIPPEALALALSTSRWVTCNAREASLLTKIDDPLEAARALADGDRRACVVRDGAHGCVIALPAAEPERIPGFIVHVLDTNGAGDTHTGVFVAALARGATPSEAARLANAAAAFSVTVRGPATAPTAIELADFLERYALAEQSLR